jgi:hypothetical protein
MVSLRHSKVAIGDDNPDRQVSVSHWNAEHSLTGTANYLLGFDGSGNATSVAPSAATSSATTSATAADNSTAIAADLARLKASALTGYGYNDGSIWLRTPTGHYSLSSSITPQHALEIRGDLTTAFSGGGTVFEMTANVDGFSCLSPDCNGVRIKGLELLGTNGGTDKHAINQTGFLYVEDFYAKNWSGDAIHADSTSGGLSGSIYRNVGGEDVDSVISLNGADSNGCLIEQLKVSNARFFGLNDSSGAGATMIGGVINSSGNASGFLTRSEKNGHIFMVAPGQTVGASTNSPPSTATNNTWWWYVAEGSPSATQPTWTTGQTWYESSPIRSEPTDGNVATSIFGPYVEPGQNAIVLSDPSTLVGGAVQVPVYNQSGFRHGGFMRGDGGYMLFNNAIKTQGPNGNVFQNSISVFGPQSAPTAAQDQEVQFQSWNATNVLSFYVNGVSQGAITNFNSGIIHDFDTTSWRTKGGGTALATLDTTGYNLTSGGYKVAGTTAIDSSRNGSFGTVTATGLVSTPASASGGAGLTLPHGAAPTSPVNGNVWTTTGGIFWRINGATVQVATGGGTATGTNTGDQTITLTSDVTGSGTGSFATTIAANAVTFAKFQQLPTVSLVGNSTGGTANAQSITLAADHSFSGTTIQLGAFTGDITKSAGSLATTIGTNIVTYAKFQQVAANSLVGNPTGSLANAQGITLAGGLAFSGTTLTAAGALTPTSVVSTGKVTSSSATAGIGYDSGARGTVTQNTSKATGVTSNTVVTDITLNGAALASATVVSFVFTNSAIAANDTLILNHVTTGTFGAYVLNAHGFAAGSCTIDVRNVSAGSLSEAIVIRAVLVKGG